MNYLGNFNEDQTIYFMWNTNGADGASITRGVNGVISVYKNDNIIQVTTGVTDTEDFDGLTGVHFCKIITTDAWYETGHSYAVVLSGCTIDGQVVNSVIAQFSIESRFMRGTDSAYTGTPPTVDAIKTKVEEVGSSLATILTDTNDLQTSQGAWATATSVTVSDKTGFSLSGAGVDAILDENIEGTHSMREMFRLFAAVLIGKSSGGGTATITFRDIDDGKDRVIATVTSNGNRTSMSLTET